MKKTYTKRGVAKALREAAKLLNEKNWAKGYWTYMDGNGTACYCAGGALCKALHGVTPDGLVGTRQQGSYCEFSNLIDRLGEHYPPRPGYSVTWFNDQVALNVGDVQRWMRSTANKLEHGGAL